MKHTAFATRLPIPLTLLAAACGGLDPAATGPAQAPPDRLSAGNVGLDIAPDRDPAAIALLRGRGRPALDELLATYDRMTDGAARSALAATIDQVAAQRYATVSRLFWHTDLDAARAESSASGRPILSLRMLGRLDEDLSCANSRFFRTILYPDPTISALLRREFVLHWSSERPVPRVTIDFGDGRKLERTVTGNSIHYVLDASGAPIDALPGLYAPSVFRAELQRSAELYRQLAKATDPRARRALIQRDHAGRAAAAATRWNQLAGTITYDVGAGQVLTGAAATAGLEAAQRAAMSKMRVEAPELAQIDIGPDPGALLPDVTTWSAIGQAVFGFGPAPAPAARPELPALSLGARLFAARRRPPAPEPAVRSYGLLSRPARDLIVQLMRRDARATEAAAPSIDQVIVQLERSVIADTAINELQLRPRIHQRLATEAAPTFAELNRFAYDELFNTPASDRWLGLLPRDVFTGLPGDGVVIPR